MRSVLNHHPWGWSVSASTATHLTLGVVLGAISFTALKLPTLRPTRQQPMTIVVDWCEEHHTHSPVIEAVPPTPTAAELPVQAQRVPQPAACELAPRVEEPLEFVAQAAPRPLPRSAERQPSVVPVEPAVVPHRVVARRRPTRTVNFASRATVPKLAPKAQTTGPVPLVQTRPHFPPQLRASGVEGTVILRVEIGVSGRVSGVTVKESSGHVELDRSAIAAVSKWRFTPAQRGGRPVAIRVTVPIVFRLART